MKSAIKISRREIVLKGIPTSPGIAIGKTLFLSQKSWKPERKNIKLEDVDAELERLKNALSITSRSIENTRSKATKELGEIVGRIFDSHLLVLEDEILFEEVREKVRLELVAVDYALYAVMSKTYNSLMAHQKDYFRERADDIRDVGLRLLLNLSGQGDKFESQSEEPVIIAARIITPSEIVHLDRSKLLGVMTDIGGATSHTAILTRALEVPAVVGLKKVSMLADVTDMSVINGNSGKVIINPTANHQQIYREKQKHYLQFYSKLANLKDLPTVTTDGWHVKLMANIELPVEVEVAKNHGAEGIGLFRTEYLYLVNNQFPSEEEQFREYKRLVERMNPYPVTIRTFDLGGDKAPIGLDTGREANPFMGMRAVRISLAEPDLFKMQIRAVLRASVYGSTRLMFPLVTGIAEWRQIKKIVKSVMNELDEKGIEYDKNIKIGIMIEVPSAVIMAPELAKEVDFFSIGTNDLIQFTLAADRGNEMVAHLFQALHPAILRMVKMTVEAGHSQGIEVGMCGEMAADPLATMILTGLGLDQLSVSPLMLPELRKIIRSISYAESQEYAKFILSLKTNKDIYRSAEQTMKERFADMPIWFYSKNNDSIR